MRLLVLLVVVYSGAVVAPLVAGGPARSTWTEEDLRGVHFKARLVLDPQAVEEAVGDRLDEEFVLVELEVTPLYGAVLELDRADFRLRSRYDNDSSEAQSPARIAGSAVLSLETEQTGGGGIFGQQNGPIIGGVPGTGGGPPRRMGDRVSGIGSGTLSQGETSVHREEHEETDLVGRLAQLELPMTGDDKVSGYLYFQVDPKRKLKHYVFYYDGAHGELKMEFDK